MGRLLARFKFLIGRKTKAARSSGDEKLESDRQKIEEKNQRLKKLRERLEKKDQELNRLRTELGRSRSEASSASASDRNATIFFLVGRAKSGTSWLMRILDAHPEILCKGEGRFFGLNFKYEDLRQTQIKYIQPNSLHSAILGSEYLRTWVERSVWTQGEDADEHLANLTRLATEYFLTQRLLRTGKRIVGDKTPFFSAEVLREISVVCPEAKTIHIIRDGRDVALSTIHHMWNHSRSEGGIYDLTPEELAKRDKYRDDPSRPPDESLFTEARLTSIAAGWSIEVGKAMEDGGAFLGDNYAEVRYEDLLERPEEEVGSLLNFLGADAREEIVRHCVDLASFEKWTKGRARGQEDSTNFLRKGVAGDWRTVFTERDKQIFKEVAGDLLIRLGYEEDHGW